MDRPRFVEALAVSGAFAWHATDGEPSEQSSLSAETASTVPFTHDPLQDGLAPSDIAALFTVSIAATPADQLATYPQSVASGDPSSNGIVLWTRIDPAAKAITGSTVVAWQIGTSGGFEEGTLLVKGVSEVDPHHVRDNTVKLAVHTSALHPYSTYFYRFIYNQVPSRVGRFKTLPAASDALESLRLGYVVCQDYGHGFYNALFYLAQEDIDYVVHLGDYIYETVSSGGFQGNPARTVPPFPSGSLTMPQSVDDYRHLYKVYKSDLNQQAVHERFAYIQLWDDHEFANDCHQDFHPDNNTAQHSPTTAQPALRQAANQAWVEYGLANVAFDARQDWEHSVRVYRKFSFGTLADLVVTDERLYRDPPPCGNNQIFQRYFSVGCDELHDNNRTMLGAEQRQWFLDQILNSQATWKLWANEVMLMQLKVAEFVYVDLDQWDGYPKERENILKVFRDAKVKNLIALTGDLHTFLAGYLKPDFNNPFETPVGIELMVGSITSANLEEEIKSVLHLPSAPMPAKQFGVPADGLRPLIELNNLHIKYWDSATHGYGLLEITPQNLQCVFKAVTTITQPNANLVTLKTFKVPVDQVKLEIE